VKVYYDRRAHEYDDWWLGVGLYSERDRPGCHLEEAERLRFLSEARRVAPELVVVGSMRTSGTEATRWEQRVLKDGSRWTVYKRVFMGSELADELGGGEVLHEGRYFVVVRA